MLKNKLYKYKRLSINGNMCEVTEKPSVFSSIIALASLLLMFAFMISSINWMLASSESAIKNHPEYVLIASLTLLLSSFIYNIFAKGLQITLGLVGVVCAISAMFEMTAILNVFWFIMAGIFAFILFVIFAVLLAMCIHFIKAFIVGIDLVIDKTEDKILIQKFDLNKYKKGLSTKYEFNRKDSYVRSEEITKGLKIYIVEGSKELDLIQMIGGKCLFLKFINYKTGYDSSHDISSDELLADWLDIPLQKEGGVMGRLVTGAYFDSGTLTM